MLRSLRRSAGILGGVLAAFAAISWWALESDGVAILQTRRPDGSPRSTHVWYVTRDGELWLEAGAPGNAWFQDVRADPRVSLEIDGRVSTYRADPIPGEPGHAEIRSLMREKYGLRDRWVGGLFDTSRSVAVRLLPSPPGDATGRAAPGRAS